MPIGSVWAEGSWESDAWASETWAAAVPPTGWDDSWEWGAWVPGSWGGYHLGTATLSDAVYHTAEVDDEPL